MADAIRLIIKTGKGALMGKIDIKNAYRIIPIHPDDRYLLSMKWRDQYFVDLALPFGLRSAPGIFNTLADSYEWVLQNNYDIPDLLHYLDDFSRLARLGRSPVRNRLARCNALLSTPASPLPLKSARALQPVLCFGGLS